MFSATRKPNPLWGTTMRTVSLELKVHILALTFGFAIVAAFLSAFYSKSAGAESRPDPQPKLDQIITERVDEELKAPNAFLMRILATESSDNEITHPSFGSDLLLAHDRSDSAEEKRELGEPGGNP